MYTAIARRVNLGQTKYQLPCSSPKKLSKQSQKLFIYIIYHLCFGRYFFQKVTALFVCLFGFVVVNNYWLNIFGFLLVHWYYSSQIVYIDIFLFHKIIYCFFINLYRLLFNSITWHFIFIICYFLVLLLTSII